MPVIQLIIRHSKYSYMYYFCGLIDNLLNSPFLLFLFCLSVFVSVDLSMLLITKSLVDNFA